MSDMEHIANKIQTLAAMQILAFTATLMTAGAEERQAIRELLRGVRDDSGMPEPMRAAAGELLEGVGTDEIADLLKLNRGDKASNEGNVSR